MKIIITEPFARKLKKLKKKYPRIRDDLKKLLSDMEGGRVQVFPYPACLTKSARSDSGLLI